MFVHEILALGRAGGSYPIRSSTRKCYVESLKLKNIQTLVVNTKKVGSGVKPLGDANGGEKAPLILARKLRFKNPKVVPSGATYFTIIRLFSLHLFGYFSAIFY